MKIRSGFICGLMGMALLAGGKLASSAAKSSVVSQPSLPPQEVDLRSMIEGEKRYRINCGRCHQPPHRFSPREMAMAVRHMRVRAMLTEEDMKFVIYYLTH
ncbi:MAG: cytochrome c [Acidobacteria bacterium]|nr:cytochrome c [Acidobacteriota bacterium]